MAAKMWGNEYRTTTICVDSYDKSVPEGRFYNLCCPEGVYFYGVIDLIKKMETMLDENNIVQSFSAVRSFSGKSATNVSVPSGGIIHKGKVATFATKVLFRQNTSWQGSISWIEGRSEEPFRSVLELLLLIDSALN